VNLSGAGRSRLARRASVHHFTRPGDPSGVIFRAVRTLPCSALLLAASLSTAASAAAPAALPEVLPFLENDYAGAVVKAKAKGVPVFVDVWAPW